MIALLVYLLPSMFVFYLVGCLLVRRWYGTTGLTVGFFVSWGLAAFVSVMIAKGPSIAEAQHQGVVAALLSTGIVLLSMFLHAQDKPAESSKKVEDALDGNLQEKQVELQAIRDPGVQATRIGIPSRNVGIVTILVGVAILLLVFVFSEGHHPRWGFVANLSRMVIVLDSGQGKYVGTASFQYLVMEGRVAVPSKYPIAGSIVIIVLGFGIVLLSRPKKDP